MKKIVFLVILISVLGVFFYSCQYTAKPQQITVHNDTITLSWDLPDFSALEAISPIVSYKVFYRRHGDFLWLLIAEIEAKERLEYTLNHDDIGDGLYEFAVSAINEKNCMSMLHTSIDQNASPFGGWYVLWINTN
jgi:hypothetical protein